MRSASVARLAGGSFATVALEEGATEKLEGVETAGAWEDEEGAGEV